MKKLLLLIMTSFLLASCWKQDPQDSKPRKLPQGVYAQDTVHVMGPVNVWSVEEQEYIVSWGKVRDSLVPRVEYEVIPNGEQVMKYSKATGWSGQLAIGIILVVLGFAALFVGTKFIDIKDAAKSYVRVIGLVVAIGVGFMTIRPANIARNNAKTVTEKQLKHYQAIDSNLNYFWDSIYQNNKLLK